MCNQCKEYERKLGETTDRQTESSKAICPPFFKGAHNKDHLCPMGFLFDFESHEQFFNYLATVTFTGDRAAKLDLCLALTAFSSEVSFTRHIYCNMGPPFLRSYLKDP
jgi:hypothetical protein